MQEYKRTNGKNKDFIENCRRLDADLDQRVGKEIQRSKYEKHNQLDKINEAIVVYENNVLVGAGSIRYYDEINVELKRIYISPAFRGQGLGTKKMNKYERKMSFAVMLFGYAEVIIHLLGASSSRIMLLENGIYSPFYGPGMLTALVCWLPLAIVYTAYFVKTHVKKRDVIGGGTILVALSILLITMPESLLKSEDTPYVYDNAGWYEQWIDDSGEIINRGKK